MYHQLETAIDKSCAETLGVRPKRNCPSWVSAKTIELLDRRDKAKKIFQSRRTPETRKRWRELADQVNASSQAY